MRRAKSQGPELLEHGAAGINEGIVIWNQITSARRVERMATDRVASLRVLIDVDTQHAAEEAAVDLLARLIAVVVADRQVQEAIVRMEEHRPAVVNDALALLIDEHELGSRIERKRPIRHLEPREAVV